MLIKIKLPTSLRMNAVNLTLLIVGLHLVLRTCDCDTYYPGNMTRSNSIDRRKSDGDTYSGGGGGGGGGGGDDDDEDSGGGLHSDEYTHVRGGCSSCVRDEIKNRNIQVIKDEVLKKMGFERPPNFTGKVLPQVPRHILAMVDVDSTDWQSDQPHYSSGHSVTEEDDEYHVKTEKIITFAQPYARIRHGKGHDVLYFSFSDSITKYHVANATLFVYVKGVEKRPPQSVVLEVFKVYEAPGAAVKVASRKVIQPFGHGDWVPIDVSGLVSEWFKNSKENLGFIINSTTADGRKIVYTDKTSEGGKRIPYVEITTKDVKRRLRRNSLNCDERSNENICCRYPLTVNFEEFGWDFIIAPKKYDAHYCAGECSYLTMQKYPHTHLATIAAPNTATPCCAPRKLSAISMLYFDQHMNVVLGSLPGMVVDRCGCS